MLTNTSNSTMWKHCQKVSFEWSDQTIWAPFSKARITIQDFIVHCGSKSRAYLINRNRSSKLCNQLIDNTQKYSIFVDWLVNLILIEIDNHKSFVTSVEIENQKRDLILSKHFLTLTFKLTFKSTLLIKMMLLLSPMVAFFSIIVEQIVKIDS